MLLLWEQQRSHTHKHIHTASTVLRQQEMSRSLPCFTAVLIHSPNLTSSLCRLHFLINTSPSDLHFSWKNSHNAFRELCCWRVTYVMSTFVLSLPERLFCLDGSFKHFVGSLSSACNINIIPSEVWTSSLFVSRQHVSPTSLLTSSEVCFLGYDLSLCEGWSWEISTVALSQSFIT